jgi:modulator of FtsH protease
MIMVFANLITQLGITYYVMTNTKVTKEDNHNLKHWLLVASTFAIIFVLALVPMPSWLKFILFSAFSYIWGILLAPIKNNTAKIPIVPNIAIFIKLSSLISNLNEAFLLATGIELGLKTGFFLFVCLAILIIAQIFNIFYKSTILMKLLAAVGIVIFSGYIIYDTNTILQRNYYGDFITASLDYYLDILNIFVRLTTLNDN